MCCVETKGGAMYCSLIYYKSLSPLLCSVCVLPVYNICVSVSWNMDKLSSLFSLNLAGTKHANKSADEINILIGYFVSCFSSALTFQSSVTSHVHLDFSQTRFTLLHKLFPERFGGEDGRGAWETTIFPKLGVLADPKGVMTDLWCKDSWEKVPKNKLKAHVSCCVESNRNWKSLIKIVPAKSLRCLFIWGMNRAPRAPFYQAWGRLSQNDGTCDGSTRPMASKFNFPETEWCSFF